MDARESPARDQTSWAKDWIAIWQSEWRALAYDREQAEAAFALASMWAEPTPRQNQSAPDDGADHQPAGRPRAGQPQGAAAAMAAPGDGRPAPHDPPPDDRDRRLTELAARVEDLERRLGRQPAEPAAR